MAAKSSFRLADVGRVIRYHRDAAGLTRARLSLFSGVSETAIYDVETGKPTVRLDTVTRLLETLNVDVSFESPLMDGYAAWASQP